MFQNLKLIDTSILENCFLKSLGKINIICGKNNSGKSTLLNSIRQSKEHAVSITDQQIDLFFQAAVEYTGWLDPIGHARHREGLLKVLFDIANLKPWFPNEGPEFFLKVHTEFTNKVGFGISNKLSNTYSLIFEEFHKPFRKIKVILLPPKRNLQLENAINMSEVIEPDGRGILNYLFYAKGQSESSEDRKIYEAIRDAFTKISSGYKFEIFPSKNNQIQLNFAHTSQNWVGAEFCGLGLQDLLVILYFSIHPEYQVILIEEPESHLHPDMQRRLLYFLREETEKQFFMTTHSNVFLNNAFLDKVFFTSFKDSIVVNDATKRASILDDLGYSVTDNLVSDLVILVEGPSDVGVVEEFLIKLGLYGNYNIKILPLGGDIMDQVDISVFGDKNSVIALVDKDPGSERVRKKFIANCKRLGFPYHRLSRYAIENYFTVNALRSVFHGQISDKLTEIEPDKKLFDQIKMDVKKNNRKIAKAMSLDDIKDTDLYKFFTKIERLLK
ncbi:MAG TPA: AAA family ATPase [Pyrinomonadaceae bacterium]|jgi:hypothetical protein